MKIVKETAKTIPGVKSFYIRLLEYKKRVRSFLWALRLRAIKGCHFEGNLESNIIVSLTSFPPRLPHAWAPIECMFNQITRPRKIVLVLAEEEFPDRKLPKVIQDQCKRGLEILWCKQNIKSYKKLLPVIEKYPDAEILTIDDDVYYPRDFLSTFIKARTTYPKKIIGGRGWRILYSNGSFHPYSTWPKANTNTPKNLTFLTGVGGILYPPGVLCLDSLLNIEDAMRCCPSADDIWFWAIARISNAEAVCLDLDEPVAVRAQEYTPKLKELNLNHGANDRQLKDVVGYFSITMERESF